MGIALRNLRADPVVHRDAALQETGAAWRSTLCDGARDTPSEFMGDDGIIVGQYEGSGILRFPVRSS